ncbi:MAG: hypothetical protein Q4D34_06950 [Eggerthellaceae bacterium]|nr:hypothetical protein [Eggerthellaceae bacterium]
MKTSTLALVIAALLFIVIQSIVSESEGTVLWQVKSMLKTEWVEVNGISGYPPATLTVSGSTIAYKDLVGESGSVSYRFDGNSRKKDLLTDEFYLKCDGARHFDDAIFHVETLEDGEQIPVLSLTVFEYDGRGEIISEEFVPRTKRDLVPDDFTSTAYKKRNDREVPSMEF